MMGVEGLNTCSKQRYHTCSLSERWREGRQRRSQEGRNGSFIAVQEIVVKPIQSYSLRPAATVCPTMG